MTFMWHDRELALFDHKYNKTITNERAVELPVAFDWFGDCAFGSDGLEVGNVLAHYDAGRELPSRRIVDQFEKARGVDNVDVLTIDGSYDWIVSISTVEHVREGKNPWGAVAALCYLRGMLRTGGRMLVTVGLGQNPVLDQFIMGPFGAAPTVYVRERGAELSDNVWTPGVPDAAARVYGPEHGANALWIGEWQV